MSANIDFSTAEYAHRNTNDATTTREYFTGRNFVKIQPSETLPLLQYSSAPR